MLSEFPFEIILQIESTFLLTRINFWKVPLETQGNRIPKSQVHIKGPTLKFLRMLQRQGWLSWTCMSMTSKERSITRAGVVLVMMTIISGDLVADTQG